VQGSAWRGLLLFLAAICSEIFIGHNALGVYVTVATAGIIAIGYTAAATIARQNFKADSGQLGLRDILVLIIAGMGAAIVVATAMVGLFIAVGILTLRDYFPSVLRSLIGDSIGIIVISPILLRFSYLRQQFTAPNLAAISLEVAIYGILIAMGLWIIVSNRGAHGSNFFYILFLPVVITAVRFGVDGACLSLLATQIGLVQLLQQYGSDADTFTEYQTLMFALTATGLVVGAIVSEREQAQLAYRRAMEQLKNREGEAIRAGRFNLASGMAAALAHEINQPITAARALARSAQHLLRTPAPDVHRVDRNLATMIGQIDVAGRIVRGMREFLQRGRPSLSQFAIRELLDDALLLIRPEAFSAQIACEVVVPPDLSKICGDRGQLEQVVLNLVRNSIDSIAEAKRGAGHIRIEALKSERRCELEIRVKDNGRGVSAEVADRLFEPLTTSKEHGLGLGLSICASIVEAHRGKIWLEATSADGTEFRLRVPFGSVRPS
jgi:two-component system sensor kinase FixL